MRTRTKWSMGIVVAVMALAGWGLTNAVQKVQQAAARTQDL